MTTAFHATIGIALLVDTMRVTSELTVMPLATCELWMKHTSLDEQDDCERVGGELDPEPTVSYALRTSLSRPSH